MNQAQASSLRTTLLMLNRTIRLLEDTINTTEVVEPLFFWRNPLTKEKKSRIASSVAEIRGRIREIAREQGIEAEDEGLLKDPWARLSTHWVSIEEAKSKAMSRYGSVSPEDAATLDPAMENLSALVTQLMSVLGSR